MYTDTRTLKLSIGDSESKVPGITNEMLEALELLYPNSLPDFSHNADPQLVAQSLAYLQGQQSILTRLRFEHDQSEWT